MSKSNFQNPLLEQANFFLSCWLSIFFSAETWCYAKTHFLFTFYYSGITSRWNFAARIIIFLTDLLNFLIHGWRFGIFVFRSSLRTTDMEDRKAVTFYEVKRSLYHKTIHLKTMIWFSKFTISLSAINVGRGFDWQLYLRFA
jgi:hypothetical protein